MNVMVLSVSDRAKEIGMRKTVGATSMNIFIQFLIESVVLSALGGAFGLLLSYGTILVIPHVVPVTPELTLSLSGYGLMLAAGTGLIFGISPALSAARREPIEILQTER